MLQILKRINFTLKHTWTEDTAREVKLRSDFLGIRTLRELLLNLTEVQVIYLLNLGSQEKGTQQNKSEAQRKLGVPYTEVKFKSKD